MAASAAMDKKAGLETAPKSAIVIGRLDASCMCVSLPSFGLRYGGAETAVKSVSGIRMSDTAANIEAGLSTLIADTGEIASITASNAPVAVSVATFLADQSALDKIAGGFSISDTAVDVAQNLDQLTAALSAGAIITSIALTDAGVPTLTISLEQALNDTLALNKIVTPH